MQKITIHKLITVWSVASVLVLAGASQAFADFQVLNQSTGFDSLNNASGLINDNFATLNTNNDALTNNMCGTITSGGNLILGNGGSNGAQTGPVVLGGQIVNDANANTLDNTLNWIVDPIVGNGSTGANSINTSSGILNDSFGVVNTNSDALANNISATGDSGHNIVQFNGGAGTIFTGSGSGNLGIDNAVNANFTQLMGDVVPTNILSGAQNSLTGAFSSNDASITATENIGVQNTNLANITNNVFDLLSSGGNVLSDNGACGLGCVGPSLSTGNAINNTSISNEANSNRTIVNADFGAMQVVASNNTTGFNSLNDADALATENVGVANINTANIVNKVSSVSLTGGNLVTGNNGAVGLSTGNAGNSVNIQNGPINVNNTNVAVGGPGQVAALNSSTGAGSLNDADAMSTTNVGVANTNTAVVLNNVSSVSASGGNVVSDNSGGCGVNCGGPSIVQTGSAANATTISNVVNANQTTVVAPSPVNVSAENSCTGAGSTNDASAVSTTNVSVVNNNTADITNNVTSTSSTGENVVSGNTGGAGVSTGGATLTLGVSNQGNTNSTTVGQ